MTSSLFNNKVLFTECEVRVRETGKVFTRGVRANKQETNTFPYRPSKRG